MPTHRPRADTRAVPAAVDRLRAHIAEAGLKEGDRLPAERDLAAELGMSRGTLRQALATAESTGEIWRHVGKGTFVGTTSPANRDELASQLARQSNPVEVIEARALLEPRLAALAALRGTPQAFAALQGIVAKGLAARDTASSHRYGNEFHQAIARMAGNHLLLGLFDAVFGVRDLNAWGKLKSSASGLEEMTRLWKHHALIAQAIISRDMHESELLMRQHIDQLQHAISGQDALVAARAQQAWPIGQLRR